RDGGPRLAAQVLIYPVLDLDMARSDRYPSLCDNADGYYVTRDELRWCVRNYLPAGMDPADPRISPARHPDLTGLPATVLAVAQYDPLRDQGTAYASALRAASVPVAVHPGLGLIHGCFDMLGVTAAARNQMGRVLRSVREALAVTSSHEARLSGGLAGQPDRTAGAGPAVVAGGHRRDPRTGVRGRH